MMGEYRDLHNYNRENTQYYGEDVLSFARFSENEKLIIISNFSKDHRGFDLKIPSDIVEAMGLNDGEYNLVDQLYGDQTAQLRIDDGTGQVRIDLDGLESFIFKIE
jgi:hypothetical protein